MKTIISLVVAVGFSLISLTGCYTRVITSESNDEIYREPETTIVIIPPPPLPVAPCPCPQPHYGPRPPVIIHPSPPDPPKIKFRKPENNKSTRPNNDGNVRDDLRRSGSRNNSDKRNR